jgi:D-xylose transport system substrate-binding protein
MRKLATIAAVLAIGVTGTFALSACSGMTGSTDSGDGIKIGFLLPETAVSRYEDKDKPYFAAKLAEICPDCDLLYANANSDPGKQQDQANSMLTQGVDVLVVDPMDGKAAASIVNSAKAVGVPVVAYDRLIASPDLAYLMSNDYHRVGVLQAQALVDKLRKDNVDPAAGGILMLNGASTDSNAATIKAGAHSILDTSGYKILAEFDTWDPAEAQKWVSGQVTRFQADIAGIYSANDGNAGAAAAALKAAGVQTMPPITGMDASLAGLQAVLAGDQYMTTYNSFKAEAESAAEVAVQLAKGQTPAAETEIDGIPATLRTPTPVYADTITTTVIADGFYQPGEICTATYATACVTAGITP